MHSIHIRAFEEMSLTRKAAELPEQTQILDRTDSETTSMTLLSGLSTQILSHIYNSRLETNPNRLPLALNISYC